MNESRDQAADLSPLKRALVAVRDLKARLDVVERARTEAIAIVGMACRFPGGATDLDRFWALLDAGVDTIRPVPRERWNAEAYYDPDPEAPGKTYAREGGFLDEIDRFDAGFFGIPPREVTSMDPQQRLLLEVAWEALENAGIPPSRLAGTRTGVFIGTSTADYAHLMLSAETNTADPYVGTGGIASVAAGRVAYVLGLRGPTMAIDTACSSSLVAVDLAVQQLRAGRCEAALVGGVNAMLTPKATVLMSSVRALSPTNRCKTFDADADGYVRGEGCGMLVLKRLSDAERDGDSVLAVIRGSAANHDGTSSGLTVPNGQAQQAVIRQALADAGLQPVDIDVVEAHGTGTPLGDPIELRALGAVLGEGRPAERPLYVAAVKTNIGHLEAAAGVAALIKAVLAVQHRRVPGSLHFRRPNPNIPWDELPIRIPTASMAWPQAEKPATIGVSSFGISGTNAHVIVQEAPAQARAEAPADRPAHVFTASARSEDALRSLARTSAEWLEQHPQTALADAAFSANTGRTPFDHRIAVATTSAKELAAELRAFAAGDAPARVVSGRSGGTRPKIAFLFTGQGAQYVGMGRELYDSEPVFRSALDRCAAALQSLLPVPLLDVMFGTADGENGAALLNQTGYTQPALFSLEYALAELWRSWGVEPSFVAGHSVGEYAAACVAGLFDVEHGLTLIAERARLMQSLPAGGGMTAVFAPAGVVADAIRDSGSDLSIAALNGPEHVVVSGATEQLTRLHDLLASRGITSKPLVVSHAFHSALMEPILGDFERAAAGIPWQTPRVRLVANLTGQLAAPRELATAAYWTRHIREAVQFDASVRTLVAQGCDTFIEIGPHPTLLALAAASAQEKRVASLPSLRRGQGEYETLLRSIGAAWVRGAAVDWRAFDQGRPRRRVMLPNYPFERQRYWFTAGTETPRVSAPAGPALHPLVHERVRSPLLKERVFQSSVSTAAVPYLRDHRVFDAVVFPATGYLEMARAAAAAAFGQPIGTVEQLVLEEPLILGDDRARVVQIAIAPLVAGVAEFQILSDPESDDIDAAWMRHAQGRIRPGRAEASAVETLDAVRGRCRDALDVKAYYATLTTRGIAYGPAFQAIDRAWRGRWESLACLTLPGAAGASDAYDVHPALLDAALQAMGAAFPSDHAVAAGGSLYLPIEIGTIHLVARPGSTVWSHAVVSEPSSAEPDTLSATVTWYDEAGALVASLDGITVKRASSEALRRAMTRPVHATYGLTWVPLDAASSRAAATGERWLVVAETEAGARAVASELGADGASCSVAAADTADRVIAAMDGALNGVVYAAGVDAAMEADAPDPRALRLCGGLLRVVQSLVRHRHQVGTPRLSVLTRGAHAITAAETDVDPVQASLWGLGRVIAAEHPELRWTAVDVAASDEPVPSLLALLRPEDRENQVAVRNGRRYGARLAKEPLAVAPSEAALDPNATYLITGGLNGIGLRVAESLAGRAGHLTLTARSAPGAEAQAAITRIEARGTQVMVVRGDIGSREDATGLFGQISATGRPLRGVVHAAGVIDDAVIVEQNMDRFARVMQPKVAGSWLLHELTADAPLDFFVMFSSTTSVLGAPGQANYAAANAFVDALAHRRRAAGKPAVSINWGAWAEVGMVARMDAARRQRITASGVTAITPQLGLRIFETLLSASHPQVIVLPVDWGQLLSGFAAGEEPPLFAVVARDRVRPANDRRAAADEMRRKLEVADPELRRRLLVDYTRAQVARVLGVASADSVDGTRDFSELGLDSLMMLELRNALTNATGRSLPATFLYEQSTVERVAAALAGDPVGAPPASDVPAAAAPRDDAAGLLARLGELSDDNIDALLGAMLTESNTPK